MAQRQVSLDKVRRYGREVNFPAFDISLAQACLKSGEVLVVLSDHEQMATRIDTQRQLDNFGRDAVLYAVSETVLNDPTK